MNKAVLSDNDIIREMKAGNIVIYDPKNPNSDFKDKIQNCSVDITLGEHIYRSSEDNKDKKINIWSSSNNYWDILEEAKIIKYEYEGNEYDLKVGDKYFVLKPNELILAHTEEFIGGRNYITTMMKSRSSIGRSGLCICNDAGWGDIGYINRWTMEIKNNSQSHIILPVGKRIGQIIFLYSTQPSQSYHGKYQTHTDIESIVNSWSPESMLPKLHLDN